MSRIGRCLVGALLAFGLSQPLSAGGKLVVAPASHGPYGGYHRYGPYYGYRNNNSANYHGHYAFGAPRYYGYAYSYRPYYYRPTQFAARPSYYYPGYSYAAASTYYRPYYAYGYPSLYGPTGYGVYTYAPGTFAYGYPPVSSYYYGNYATMGFYQPGYAVSVGFGGPVWYGAGYPSYRYYSYGGFGNPFAMSFGYYGW